MKLVVGLGNPGREYAGNRHNAGFMVIDELIRRCNATTQTKFKGEMARGCIGQTDAIFLKPMTYMNNSGISVGLCASFYDVAPEDTVVVHDDLDLDYGMLRIKRDGGHGGHNGLRSMFEHFSKGDFARLRFGIGRPAVGSPKRWVLGDFSTEEAAELDDLVCDASRAVESILNDGVDSAMNQFNQRKKKETSNPAI